MAYLTTRKLSSAKVGGVTQVQSSLVLKSYWIKAAGGDIDEKVGGFLYTSVAIGTVTSAGSGSVTTAGPTTYRYTYYNIDLDLEGPYDPTLYKTHAATVTNKTFAVTLASVSAAAPPEATHIRLYRNSDGSDTDFRLVAQITAATSSYNDNTQVGDLSLVLLDSALGWSTLVPTPRIIYGFQDRVWIASRGKVWFTHAGDPSRMSRYGFLKIGDAGDTESDSVNLNIKAMRGMGGSLVVYTDKSINVIDYDIDPRSSGVVSTVASNFGALNHHCVADKGGVHFVHDVNTIYAFIGIDTIIDLGDKIRPILNRRNMDVIADYSAEGDDRKVRFTVALDNDTECKHCLVLDLATFTATGEVVWMLEQYDQGLAHIANFTFGQTTTAVGVSSDRVMCAMDYDGNIFAMDWLTSDGVPTSFAASGIVASVTTASMSSGKFPTNTTFSSIAGSTSTSYNLKNLTIRFMLQATYGPPAAILAHSGGYQRGFVSDPYVISSVSSGGKVVLTTSLSASDASALAPGTGTAFVVGSIASEWRTKKYSFGSPSRIKTAANAVVEFVPQATAVRVLFVADPDSRGSAIAGITSDGSDILDPIYKSGGVSSLAMNGIGQSVSSAHVGGDGLPNGSSTVPLYYGQALATVDTFGGRGVHNVPLGLDSFRTISYSVKHWKPQASFAITNILTEVESDEVISEERTYG